jgi:hypothetical protein
MPDYQLIDVYGEICIYRLDDGAWIPDDPDNRDYQQYQLWLLRNAAPQPVNLEVWREAQDLKQAVEKNA